MRSDGGIDDMTRSAIFEGGVRNCASPVLFILYSAFDQRENAFGSELDVFYPCKSKIEESE